MLSRNLSAVLERSASEAESASVAALTSFVPCYRVIILYVKSLLPGLDNPVRTCRSRLAPVVWQATH